MRSPGRDGPAGDPAGRVIAVLGTGKGAGATTLCAHLAVAIAGLTRARAALVDLDLERGDLDVHLGVEPGYDVGTALGERHRLDATLLDRYLERHPSGVTLLAAPTWPSHVEADPHGEGLRALLDLLRAGSDHVLLDLSSRSGPLASAAVGLADEVLVVGTPDVSGVRNLCRLVRLVEAVRGAGREAPRIVLNRVRASRGLDARDVSDVAGRPVYAALRSDPRLAETSPDGALAARTPRSVFGRDVTTLARQLAGEGERPAAGRRWWQRLLARIPGRPAANRPRRLRGGET